MTRTLAAAVLAASALLGTQGAQAQSATLYGLFDVSGSRTKPVGGENRWQLDNGNLQRSFIGFRGSEDLGGGLRAVFKLESYFRPDTGAFGRSDTDYQNNTFWAREATVGLSGAFGTTVLGRIVTPLYLSTINFNAFGEGFGLSPSTRQYFGTGGAILGDSRWNNAINYTNTGGDGPLRINIAANAGEGSPGSTGRNYGGTLGYTSGPFSAVVGAERVRNGGALPTAFDRQWAYQVGATYDFHFVRVYGQAGHVKTDAANDAKTTLYQLSAAVPIATGALLVSYGHAKTTGDLPNNTNRSASLGYDYFLSKNTDIYVAGLYEKQTSLSSGHTLAGGVRLRF